MPAHLSVRVLGSSVGVTVESESIGAALRSRLSAAHAVVHAHEHPPSDVDSYVVESSVSSPPDERIGQTTAVYGDRHASVLQSKATMITTSPLTVTLVTPPMIAMVACDQEVDIRHLYNLVRFPLRAQCEKLGYVLVHAAGVTVRADNGILFIGRSGAGKTTAFLELITRGLGGLGNDAIMLLQTGDGVRAFPWPHRVRIGGGTIQANEVLRNVAPSGSRCSEKTKAVFHFDRLNALFGRPILCGSARVTGVVDLWLTPDHAPFAARRLSKREAHDLITKHFVDDRFRNDWLPQWPVCDNYYGSGRIAERLLSEVPIVQIAAGVRTSEWASRMINVLDDFAATEQTALRS